MTLTCWPSTHPASSYVRIQTRLSSPHLNRTCVLVNSGLLCFHFAYLSGSSHPCCMPSASGLTSNPIPSHLKVKARNAVPRRGQSARPSCTSPAMAAAASSEIPDSHGPSSDWEGYGRRGSLRSKWMCAMVCLPICVSCLLQGRREIGRREPRGTNSSEQQV